MVVLLSLRAYQYKWVSDYWTM